jgi:GTP pyrophosphokinase
MEAENQIIKIQHIEEVDALVQSLIDGVASYMKNVPREVIHDAIWKSYEFAKAAHDGQMRKSGNPYIVHPVRAAQHLLILKPDIVTIQSCILHDVAEDTERTIQDIEKEF